METNLFTVEITTPQKKWTFENVISCSAPGVKGSFQVLYNHAPLLSQLEIGSIKLETTDGILFFATSGGFLEVLNNKVGMLLDTAEKSDQIDVTRAGNAAERARNRLKERAEDLDAARAEASLARALNRLYVAQKTE
ncbi:MAG: F0F1 ATP synthase subunit epsilon [Calditrichia bacterium]